MKKNLLIITLALSLQCINAQVLESDDFTALTVGNIGTDLSGATAGQGGWYIVNGLATDYQVVTQTSPYGKAIQLTGESTTATTARYFFKTGLATSWGTRTAGNDIVEVEFDLNTGAISASRNSFQCRIYNSAGQTLAGILLEKNYTATSTSTVVIPNALRGVARYTSGTTTGTYSFGFGPDTATQLVFPDNTWIRVGFSWNKTTGQVIWRAPGVNGGIAGAGATMDPDEIDFLAANSSTTGVPNTVAASAYIDNYVARASSTDTLLGVETKTRSVVVSTYPNPTVDVINVYNSNNLELSSYKVIDLKGTVIKSGVLNNTIDQKINVSDLATGAYMLKLNTTDNNTITKKIIKN